MPRGTKATNQEKPAQEEFTGVTLDFAQTAQIITEDVKRFIKLQDNNMRPRKYSRDQIRRFLAEPLQYERQLREVSQYLLVSSSHYKRLLNYFATMLTLDYVISPVMRTGEPLSDTANANFARNYEKTLKYMENFNVKHEIGQIIQVLLAEGVFFGYERSVGSSFMIQRLPTNYCKITGKEDGCWTFAFNTNYLNEQNIEMFPEEFNALWKQAQRDNQQWQELDSTKAICFKFDETVGYSIPPFTGVFEEIMDLEDYKDLHKIKTKIDNYKILVQEIPMKKDPKSEKDYVLTLGTVNTFHNAIKNVVPEGVNIISSPMKLQDISFERKENNQDTVGDAESRFFTSAGVSSSLFNAQDSGSIGLNRSIDMDAAFMFTTLRQVERFFRKRLNAICTGTQQFKIIMPNITMYNRSDLAKEYLGAAQYGFPRSYMAAALGIQTGDLVSLCVFESDFLELQDLMIPMKSSFTGDGSDPLNEGGRPVKDDSKVSDEGQKTRDGNKNKSRAK